MATAMAHRIGADVRLPARARSAAFRSTAPRPCPSRVTLSNTFLGSKLQLNTIDDVSYSGPRRVTTMAAKVVGKIKLALEAGKANPAPPVGPALGARGVNIMAFCKEYNAQTAGMIGQIIPVEITVYDDRSFTLALKTPPASVLLKKAAGIKVGSGKPNREKVGNITRAQIEEVAKTKLKDTNANNLEGAIRMVEGTAKNMGLVIVD